MKSVKPHQIIFKQPKEFRIVAIGRSVVNLDMIQSASSATEAGELFVVTFVNSEQKAWLNKEEYNELLGLLRKGVS